MGKEAKKPVANEPVAVPFNVGDYMIHTLGGALVRLDKLSDSGSWWISYVGITPSTGRIYAGGSSGWWPSSEFAPIKSAAYGLAANAHRAMLRETEATETLAEAKREQEVYGAAIKALREVGNP